MRIEKDTQSVYDNDNEDENEDYHPDSSLSTKH